MTFFKTIPRVLAAALVVATSSLTGTAFAHVTVTPTQVPRDSFQTFTVSVPNEQDIATTSVKLVIPGGAKFVTPTLKPGWTIDVERDGDGKEAVIKSITWSGNEIGAGFRDEFTFAAKVPETKTELQWKAYQTYADGKVVAWDQVAENDKGGPLSVTKVSGEDTEGAHGSSSTNATPSSDTTSLYLSVSALVVAVAALALTLVRKKA